MKKLLTFIITLLGLICIYIAMCYFGNFLLLQENKSYMLLNPINFIVGAIISILTGGFLFIIGGAWVTLYDWIYNLLNEK